MAEVNGDGGPVQLAAGGVIWRLGAGGGLEVLLVHRPRYDDWTFPKGKREPGDPDDEACALREVQEETGLRCVLGHELAPITYLDRHRRPKQVRYWEMRVVSGDFTPTDEVDAVRWVGLDEASGLLTYPRDTAVLDSFARFAGHRAS